MAWSIDWSVASSAGALRACKAWLFRTISPLTITALWSDK
jgi:hypothetical protein